MSRQLQGFLVVAGALALAPTSVLAQAGTGAIVGVVTDRATGTPISGATVRVVNTQLGAASDASGQYRIAGVPGGQVVLRAQRIGYAPTTQAVTLAPGATATLNIALGQAATQLEALVVTATGQTVRSREQGNVVSQVRPDSLPLAAVPNAAALFTGRVAGVNVQQSGGTSGSGARVRIRGANSVSLSNEPLIVIDGVRVNNSAESNSIGVGGQTPSRLNDIKPEDIETFEVLKGPAATGLYGTQGANGVIQITTKRGRQGRTAWSTFAEYGQLEDRNTYEPNFGTVARGSESSTDLGDLSYCTLADRADQTCFADSISVVSYSPLRGNDSPFRTGERRRGGASLSGGSAAATYFLSGDIERERGIFSANSLDRGNFRVNATGRIGERFDVSASTGYLTSVLRLPQNDNNVLGLVSGALLGNAINDPDAGGYYFIKPTDLQSIRTLQETERYTAALNTTYRPFGFLNVFSTAGLDIVQRDDNDLTPPNKIPLSVAVLEGDRERNRTQIGTYTLNSSAVASFSLPGGIASQTTLGVQFQREEFDQNAASGAILLAGTSSLNGTNARFAVGESNQDSRLFGALVQQQLSFRDRIYATAGLRGDDNSAFGQNFGFAYFPSAQLSWVVSEEGFFPNFGDALTSFRVRGAAGQSGLRPGNLDAIRFFSPVAVRFGGVEQAAFTVGGAGNTELKPERTTEFEGGFDLNLFDGRVALEATYFGKTSTDALVAQRLAPSLGLSSTRFTNLGKVTNKGFEALLTTRLLTLENAQADITFNYSTLANTLVSLGKDAAGNELPAIIFGLGGDTQRHTTGRPLGAYYQRPYTFSDANKDGIIGYDEVELKGDTAVYLGNIMPSRTLAVSPSIRLFKVLHVTALIDHRGGYKLFNSSTEFRCGSFYNCRDVYVAGTSLEKQARAVANQLYGTSAGYMEDADFTRLREVAVTISAPERIASAFRTTGLSLTLAGRNLATWTKYSGTDPEVNFAGQANFSSADFLTQPPVRFVTARVNVNF